MAYQIISLFVIGSASLQILLWILKKMKFIYHFIKDYKQKIKEGFSLIEVISFRNNFCFSVENSQNFM